MDLKGQNARRTTNRIDQIGTIGYDDFDENDYDVNVDEDVDNGDDIVGGGNADSQNADSREFKSGCLRQTDEDSIF